MPRIPPRQFKLKPAPIRTGIPVHSSATPVPRKWRPQIAEVLIDPPTLRRRVRELARLITADAGPQELVIVALLNGTVLFLADLIRSIQLPLRLDFIGVSSYRSGTVSRELVYTKELRLDVKGRDVVLVDDILDTGRTLADVQAKLLQLKPARLRSCVLLDKPSRRTAPVTADYTGFQIPDSFVVGYGLDYAEKFRNLPFVGTIRP